MSLVKHPALTLGSSRPVRPATGFSGAWPPPSMVYTLKNIQTPKAGMSQEINSIGQKGGLEPKPECPLNSNKGGYIEGAKAVIFAGI